jgi:hypothetical protein
MNFAAVGIKCPECARLPRSARVRLKPRRAAAAIGVAAGAGLAIGLGLAVLATVGLFFALLLGYLVGLAIGELVLRASGRYRGPETAWIAVAGSLIAYAVPAALQSAGVFTLIGAALAAYIAYRQVQ